MTLLLPHPPGTIPEPTAPKWEERGIWDHVLYHFHSYHLLRTHHVPGYIVFYSKSRLSSHLTDGATEPRRC